MNKGFFGMSEVVKAKSVFTNKTESCLKCAMDKNGCTTPCMEVYGEGRKGILILASHPSIPDDRDGVLGKGADWVRLKADLAKRDIVLKRDCKVMYAVSCRPEKDTKESHIQKEDILLEPTSKEIIHCRPKVLNVIQEYKPKVILALGVTALSSLVKHRLPVGFGPISKWDGNAIPDRDLNTWIIPSYSYIEAFTKRGQKQPTMAKAISRNVDLAIDKLDEPLPSLTKEEAIVKVILSEDRAIQALREIIREVPEYIAFDYETSGIKPHKKGHFIECIGISWDTADEEKAICILITDKIKKLLARIMKDERIKKIAHNAKFEDMWTREIIGTEVDGWHWCTQMGAHIIDHRKNITSLKYQVYINFGVVDYSSFLDKFLKSKEKGSYSFNTVHEAPKRDLYMYCGQDALFTKRLFTIQEKRMKEDDLLNAMGFFMDGLIALMDVINNGFAIDVDYCNLMTAKLSAEISELSVKLEEYSEVATWRKMYKEKFNLNSQHQLSTLLTKRLRVKLPKTKGGSASTDEKALESMDSDFARDLIRYRKISKAKNTYLKNLTNETVDGILHPFFHLHTVTSYRSSSSGPNFQNIPVRDPEIGNLVRGAIIPRKGHQLLEIDFSGVEVSVSACVHKDEKMIEYIKDKSTDMHRDTAMDLFILDKEQVSKQARQTAKGGFVFAQFYGDYYKPCAESIWAEINKYGHTVANSDVTLVEHLVKEGINGYADFEDHLRDVENIMWNERFVGYSQWKKDFLKEYHEKGEFRTLTGFRCDSVMRKNVVHNLPVQGPAFHCLLWALTQVNAIAKKEKWNSMIIGQIHDSIIMDVDPAELQYILEVCNRIMTVDIKEFAPWLVVDLEVDAEVTDIDEPWSKKHAA